MPRDCRDVERGLTAKGFVETQGDHHYFTFYTDAGLKTPVFTKTSHGMREVGDPLLGLMAKQCRLSRREFFALLDCQLSRDDYEALLTAGGHI